MPANHLLAGVSNLQKENVMYVNLRGANSLEKTDAGKDWRQKEKKAAEDEMVREHHRLNGHEVAQTLGDSEGQEEPGMLQSTRSQRVRRNLVTKKQQI